MYSLNGGMVIPLMVSCGDVHITILIVLWVKDILNDAIRVM